MAETPADSAQAAIRNKLLEPLQKKEEKRSRFSRAALPPSARRLRLLNVTSQTDLRGRAFFAFAVDEQRNFAMIADPGQDESQWNNDSIVGCVYPESGEVMVKRGEAYFPASVLLGKTASQAGGDVCQAGHSS